MTNEEIREIYASAPVSREVFEVIELSSSWFSKSYYLQRATTDSIDVTLEDGDVVTAEYVPMSLGQSSSNEDLNYERNIIVQMVNDTIAGEQANYDYDTHGDEMPQLTSRGYILYRNGDVSQIKQPAIKLPVRKMRRDTSGAVFNVSTKPANESATGEVATVTRVPMLKGFL